MNILLITSILIFAVAVFLQFKHNSYLKKINDLVKNGKSTEAEIIELYIKEPHPDPHFGFSDLQPGEALLRFKVNEQYIEVNYTIDRDLSEEIANLKLNDFVDILYDISRPKRIILEAEQFNKNLNDTRQGLWVFLIMSLSFVLIVLGMMLLF
jgi:hypothetical protein